MSLTGSTQQHGSAQNKHKKSLVGGNHKAKQHQNYHLSVVNTTGGVRDGCGVNLFYRYQIYTLGSNVGTNNKREHSNKSTKHTQRKLGGQLLE